MKKTDVLNPLLINAIASLGHKEYFGIGDAGLPIPKDVQTIDLSVMKGIPSFIDVLKAVSKELVIESYIIAEEAQMTNPKFINALMEILPEVPFKTVSHQELKVLTKDAKTIVRTGECSSYSNILLVGGVNF